jgi:chromosome segregation ATPase
MGSYGIWMLLSSFISAFLGGGAMYLFTLKSKKKEAAATAQNAEAIAEGQELNNVEKAIKIWREMAESLKLELADSRAKRDELALQIDKLSEQVKKLTCITGRIAKLLDKITPENIEEIKGEIKNLIDK